VSKPLGIDLCCGLGGFTEGLQAEGYDVIGFDIEQHVYGEHRYPGMLAIQDVLTLHGKQFRNAALIVASPPCQFFSYTAMPWSKAKALAAAVRADPARLEKELALFNACFRIQREACEAAGRHIPLIVENVRGAIPWVGRSRWNFGSFHLWGDVPALMPPAKSIKVPGFRFDGSGKSFQTASVSETGVKAPGMNWSDQTKRGQDFTRIAGQYAMDGVKVPSEEGRRTDKGNGARFTSRDCGIEGIKCGGDWFNADQPSISRMTSSKSPARKAASAMIAKIPFALARHIAATYAPINPR
jgi:C-5 cytosine-specific DNA methylase